MENRSFSSSKSRRSVSQFLCKRVAHSTRLSSNRQGKNTKRSNPSTNQQAALLSNAWKLRSQAKKAEEKRKKNRWSVSLNTPNNSGRHSLMRSSLQTSELASMLSSLWKECKTSSRSRCSGFTPRSLVAKSSRGTVRSISLHTLSKAKKKTKSEETNSNQFYVRDIVFSRESGNKTNNGDKTCKIVLYDGKNEEKSLRGFVANKVLSSFSRVRPSRQKEVDPRRRRTADTMETAV